MAKRVKAAARQEAEQHGGDWALFESDAWPLIQARALRTHGSRPRALDEVVCCFLNLGVPRDAIPGLCTVLTFQGDLFEECSRVVKTWRETQAPPSGPQAAEAEQPSKETLALAILADHPDWTDTKIAKAAGCARTTLYTFEKFMAAREILREGRNALPRGSKYPDQPMEAWHNEGDG